MKTPSIAALVGGGLLLVLASAAALASALTPPPARTAAARPARVLQMRPPQAVHDTVQQPAFVVLTVEGDRPGVTEMQAPDGVVIGPGTITYPR